MENIGWLLLGIIIWQNVVFLTMLFSGEDEELVAKIGMGIPYGILCIIGMIYRPLRLKYYQKNYSLCSFYKRQEKEEFEYHGGVCIKNKDISKYYQKGENDYYINVYRSGKDLKSAPHEKITKIYKNGFFCQEFVDTNFKKK